MQLLQLALLIGTASANPLGGLFERQAPAQSCTATFLASCTGAASTSARAWCASQGFDRASTTLTRTNVVRRTVQSTATSYTSTLIVTLPTSTRTVSSVRTVVTTSTITDVLTVDRTTTVPVTGRISACPVYVPPQPVAPEISEPATTTTSPTSTAPAQTSTDAWRPGAKPAACVELSRHVYADFNGQAYEYIRCAGHGDSTINAGNRYIDQQVSSFDQCAKFCRYDDKCQGFNWATNNPTTCNMVIQGVGRLQTFDVNTAPWYYHHLVDRTTAQPEQSSVAPLPAGCSNSQDFQWTDENNVRRAYKSCTGYAYKGGQQNDYPYNWSPSVSTPNIDSCARLCRQSKQCFGFNYLPGNPTTCNLLAYAPDVLQGPFDANYPWTYYHFTGQVDGMPAKRQATLPKPVCVRATNAVQTTSACRCAIPTPATTTTSTSTIQTTSTRTLVLTRRLVSTTSVTPTAVTTVFRTSILTRTRKIVSTVTSMHTEESTVTRTLEATPTAFYIADNYEEGARHFLEWPADEDEIYYHVQYDWDSSDDEWAPTVFNLDAETLRVADLDNTEGALENYIIVGKNHDEDGTKPGNPEAGVHVLAMQGGGDQDQVQCRIEATDNDQCALLCHSNDFGVNSRDGDGLWNLMSNATEYQYTNYIFGANVELEARSLFRKRATELRRAAVKARKN